LVSLGDGDAGDLLALSETAGIDLIPQRTLPPNALVAMKP